MGTAQLAVGARTVCPGLKWPEREIVNSYLVPRFRICGGIPLLPPYTWMAWTGSPLPPALVIYIFLPCNKCSDSLFPFPAPLFLFCLRYTHVAFVQVMCAPYRGIERNEKAKCSAL